MAQLRQDFVALPLYCLGVSGQSAAVRALSDESSVNDALLPAGSAQGIIQACLQPDVIPPPAEYEIDDRTYYGKVQNLTNFYYLYQARGLLLLQEAYHFQAQQLSGQTGDPTDLGDVCTAATDSEVVTLCILAIEDTNSVYEFLARQLLLAGAPYSDDYIITQQGAEGYSPNIWVKSLEDFTQRNGGGCTYPLTSVDPCGVTVGNHTTASHPFDLTYMGYNTWAPADVDNLVDLLKDRGASQTAAAYLQSKGFVNMANKVVITENTFIFYLEWNPSPTGTAMCFLDMALSDGVRCSNIDFEPNYIDFLSRCGGGVPTFGPKSSLANIPFYQFVLAPGDGCHPAGYNWNPAPGWLLTSNYPAVGVGATSNQFRWPVTHAASLTCTDSRSATNPGGVYTRCGGDFDSWFNEQVTRPVTCGGTEYGQCINPSNDSTQLTLRGASKGRWSTPVAFGDVEIGLFATGKRAGSVSSIAGVLDVAAMHRPGRATVEFDITRVAGFYVGSIQIVDDVTGAIVALVHHRRLHQASDGTVSGHIKWLDEDGNRHGLRWSVRDGDLSP